MFIDIITLYIYRISIPQYTAAVQGGDKTLNQIRHIYQ